MRELKELEKRIGYHFQNPELLERHCVTAPMPMNIR